jgi:transcriptional regulator with XRE-family HTH domain
MAQTTDIDRLVGQRIAAARQAVGLTVRDLAARLDWPHTTLSNYETGRRSITLDRLTAIAVALQRSPAAFLVGSPEAAAIVDVIADDIEKTLQVRLVLETLDEPLPEPPDADWSGVAP